MQTDLERIKQSVLNLPPDDLRTFDDWYETNVHARQSNGETALPIGDQIERYRKARKWLDENGDRYMNQWVCLDGDQLIANGPDGLEVHRKSREAGFATPFVHRVVPEVDIGGWRWNRFLLREFIWSRYKRAEGRFFDLETVNEVNF